MIGEENERAVLRRGGCFREGRCHFGIPLTNSTIPDREGEDGGIRWLARCNESDSFTQLSETRPPEFLALRTHWGNNALTNAVQLIVSRRRPAYDNNDPFAFKDKII